MTPATTTVESFDQPDPWGFGPGADDRSAVIEYFEPLDEPVDDDDPFAAALPQPLPPTPPAAFPAPPSRRLQAPPDGAALRRPFPRQMVGVLALFAAVIMAQAFYIGFSLTGEASARPDVGDVVISSHPTGAQVLVDGAPRGTTPLVMPLTAGRHRLEVRGPAGEPERLDADVVAGRRWVRHVLLSGGAVPASPVGALRVDTGATPAQVLIDGTLAGSSPVLRSDLSAGEHAVRVAFQTGAVVERRIVLPPGETVSLVLEAPAPRAAVPAGPVSGWLRVEAPFEVQIFEQGQLVGSSASERIMMPAGAHVLELVNAALGYRVLAKPVVVPGKLVPLVVDSPRVPVAINAQPWAEVVVNGRVHGDTPIANLMLPIGVHQIVWRHPDLGERTESVTVRATGANRVSADLRR